jgi:transcriptional regulator with XRE-family HTH domain
MFHENDICRMLPGWRKSAGIKQATLAETLGVTQATVSNWETGKDRPSKRLMLRLIDAMTASAHQRRDIDQMAMLNSPAVRASFDLDGVRLVTASKGMRDAWPTFASLGQKRLSEHLVDEASLFLHDTDFVKSARRGEVALITAVSDRHIDLDLDSGFLHRWTAVFRAYGTSMHIDMTYEPCAADAKKGVEQAVMFDDLISA